MRRNLIAALLAIVTLAAAPTAALAVPSFSIDNASAQSALGQLCFNVRMHGKLNNLPSTVTFYTVQGSARDVVDYSPQRFPMTFGGNAGLAQKACVPINTTSPSTGSRSFLGKLIAGTNARLYDGTATGTIIFPAAPPPPPPPQPPVITCQDVTVLESAGAATITCSKTGPATQPTLVTYGTGGGMPTATAGVDYQEVTGSLTVPADAGGFTFQVPILNDTTVEQAESFGTTVSVVSNGTLGHLAQVTIQDDDQPPPPPPTAKWTARPLLPLNTLQYFRTTASCPTFAGQPVAAGVVFKAIPGDWAHVPDISGGPATAGSTGAYLQRGYQVDATGALLPNGPLVELDQRCVEGVTPAQ